MRFVGGIIAGIATWIVVATALNLGLRHGWPTYAAVEKAMVFTIPMMAARLSISAVSSLVSGYVAALIDRGGWAALVAGVVLLAVFIPVHYTLWSHFPIWYHLTFLISLPLLSFLAGQLVRPSPTTA